MSDLPANIDNISSDFGQAVGGPYIMVTYTKLPQHLQEDCSQFFTVPLVAEATFIDSDEMPEATATAHGNLNSYSSMFNEVSVSNTWDFIKNEVRLGVEVNRIRNGVGDVVVDVNSNGGRIDIGQDYVGVMNEAREDGRSVTTMTTEGGSAAGPVMQAGDPGRRFLIVNDDDYAEGVSEYDNTRFYMHSARFGNDDELSGAYYRIVSENEEAFAAEGIEVSSISTFIVTQMDTLQADMWEASSVTGIDQACSWSMLDNRDEDGRLLGNLNTSAADIVRGGLADAIIFETEADITLLNLREAGLSKEDAQQLLERADNGEFKFGLAVYRQGEQNPFGYPDMDHTTMPKPDNAMDSTPQDVNKMFKNDGWGL